MMAFKQKNEKKGGKPYGRKGIYRARARTAFRSYFEIGKRIVLNPEPLVL